MGPHSNAAANVDGSGASTAVVIPGESASDRFVRRLLRVDIDTSPENLVAARTALSESVVISGVRCLITYLLIPLAGAAGLLATIGRPISAVLCVLGIVFSVRSARRFWSTQNRHRWTYTVFAAVLIAYLSYGLTTDILYVIT